MNGRTGGSSIGWLCGLGVALSGFIGGCEPLATTRPAYEPALAPTTDRLMAAYGDLASKRFQVLADFETPEQGTLFRLESAGLSNPMTISTERARRETGVGALKMSLLNSSQQVVATDSPNSRWGLFRDWSKYHLLMFSVFSPRELGGFTFGITSGTDRRLTYRHPRIFLKPGWNLVRIDLADIFDQINLSDVREIRFWCDPLDTPIDLYLDDLILVDNERLLFGKPEAEPGDLYVKSQGRRLAVGSAERFELVFYRGRIVQWFDLARDPIRLHNLAGRGPLGPTPVVIGGGAEPAVRLDDLSQWSGLGAAAESFQRLEEAGPVRVVVTGQWRFGSPGEPTTEASPFHHWQYAIYADGRVYLECRGTARTATFEAPEIGIVFTCDGDQGFARHVIEGIPGGQTAPIGREPFALFNRTDPEAADLLIVSFQPLILQALRAEQDPRLGVLWRAPQAGDQFLLTAMVRVWPNDLDSPDKAAEYAVDYCHPMPISLDAGQLVRTDAGDYNNDGFSEAQGYYVLQLDGNVAKVRIDGRRHVRFGPTFRIVDVVQREVWVYMDGRQIHNTWRTQQGDVLFALPGMVTGEVLIEVNAGPRRDSGS